VPVLPQVLLLALVPRQVLVLLLVLVRRPAQELDLVPLLVPSVRMRSERVLRVLRQVLVPRRVFLREQKFLVLRWKLVESLPGRVPELEQEFLGLHRRPVRQLVLLQLLLLRVLQWVSLRSGLA
jgi:hypothetical protein